MSTYRPYLVAAVITAAGCIVYLSNTGLRSQYPIFQNFLAKTPLYGAGNLTAGNETVAQLDKSEINKANSDRSNVNSSLLLSRKPTESSLLFLEKKTLSEDVNLSTFSSPFMLDLNSETHSFNHLILDATGAVSSSGSDERKGVKNLTNNVNLKRNLTTKLIYFYNKPEWYGGDLSGCLVNACAFVTDPNLREKADAMLVHVCRIEGSPPPTRPQGQIWIGFGLESPHHYYGTYKNPAWRGVFNWSMTYRVDSDVFFPYCYITYKGLTTPDRNYTLIALGKTKTAAWFVSNCRTPSGRMQYVNKLRQYIDVDIFGSCGSNTCGREKEGDCMAMLNTTYAFYIAFENSLCQDYVTEKFYKVFYSNVDVIPVVRGEVNYTKYFPPGTFIDAEDFKNPEDLAKYLKSLVSDHEAYAAMLRRKDRFSGIGGYRVASCDLCKKLHDDKEVKMYRDFPDWVESGMCRTG